MIRFILYALIIYILFSCKRKENNTSTEIIKIETSNVISDFDLKEFMDTTFHIIPLETHENCLIGEISKLEIKNKKLFILDKLSKSILFFTMEGKFLGKISSIGRGPGEYITITDMTTTDSSVIIIDHLSRKQLEYLHSGKFMRESLIYNKIWAMNIFNFSGRIYYQNDWSTSEIGKYLLYSDTEQINSYLPFKKEVLTLGIEGPTYALTSKGVSLIYSGDDYIYHIDEKHTVTPKYFVRYNQKKAEYKSDIINVFKENTGDCILGINQIFESENYIFLSINLIDPNKNVHVIYDKKKQVAIPYKHAINSYFDNEGVDPHFLTDNTIIVKRNADMLIFIRRESIKDKPKNSIYREKLYKVIENLQDNDNPVLFLFYLK